MTNTTTPAPEYGIVRTEGPKYSLVRQPGTGKRPLLTFADLGEAQRRAEQLTDTTGCAHFATRI